MTITFGPIPHFDSLTEEEAKRILYDQLVPTLERKEILLSYSGNHNVSSNRSSTEVYAQRKGTLTLFNVERVQKAFTHVSVHLQPADQYLTRSPYLKFMVEAIQRESITNGDLIAAMLVSGFTARFARKKETLQVNCDFKAKVFS